VECTINGIGERAGNAALEEVVMALKIRADRLPFETKVHTEKLYGASQMLTGFISFGPQPNKAIVGENAFAHEAGIHQDGYLKEKSTYEIISPLSVGVPEGKLVLGKHSGRHALKQRTEDLGFQLTHDELDEVYKQFTTMADNKKGLRNEEIATLVREVVRSAQATTV
jgi:2-isopropylmalate synthase